MKIHTYSRNPRMRMTLELLIFVVIFGNCRVFIGWVLVTRIWMTDRSRILKKKVTSRLEIQLDYRTDTISISV